MIRLVKGFTAVTSALGVLALAGAAWLVVTASAGTRQAPGWLETLVARQVRRIAAPRSVRARVNPLPVTDENLRDGLRHFADHCAACHANDGSGDTPWGRSLYPKPPDLRLDATQRQSDGELLHVIENGIRFTGMPAFGDGSETSAGESWKLVQFIRHLPDLSDDERVEMESFNPKSPDQLREDEAIRKFLGGSHAQRNQ